IEMVSLPRKRNAGDTRRRFGGTCVPRNWILTLSVEPPCDPSNSSYVDEPSLQRITGNALNLATRRPENGIDRKTMALGPAIADPFGCIASVDEKITDRLELAMPEGV